MIAYYNENDAYAAQWLRNLIGAGHIAPGDVDERSIVDVRADDLRGYTQCHFFAGIGGWSLALQLAGWDDDRPVWTGSCPCQPFSAAGAGKAADDERHLWPAWFPLIRELRPAIVFGEQVEAAIGWGWLDAVFADLEEQGYACGASVLPACGVGAPHIRQRCWFVADAQRTERRAHDEHDQQTTRREQATSGTSGTCEGSLFKLGVTDSLQPEQPTRARARPSETEGGRARGQSTGPSNACELGNADSGRCGQRDAGERPISIDDTAGANRDRWRCDWLPCTDGKARPVEPGTFPLAHGLPGRVGRLRAYGNAIVPQVAAEFIKAAEAVTP